MVNDVCRRGPADRPRLGMVAQRTGLWDRRSRTPAHGFPRLPYGDRPSAPSPALPPRTAPLDPGHKARQRQAPRAHGPPIAAFQPADPVGCPPLQPPPAGAAPATAAAAHWSATPAALDAPAPRPVVDRPGRRRGAHSTTLGHQWPAGAALALG